MPPLPASPLPFTSAPGSPRSPHAGASEELKEDSPSHAMLAKRCLQQDTGKKPSQPTHPMSWFGSRSQHCSQTPGLHTTHPARCQPAQGQGTCPRQSPAARRAAERTIPSPARPGHLPSRAGAARDAQHNPRAAAEREGKPDAKRQHSRAEDEQGQLGTGALVGRAEDGCGCRGQGGQSGLHGQSSAALHGKPSI